MAIMMAIAISRAQRFTIITCLQTKKSFEGALRGSFFLFAEPCGFRIFAPFSHVLPNLPLSFGEAVQNSLPPGGSLKCRYATRKGRFIESHILPKLPLFFGEEAFFVRFSRHFSHILCHLIGDFLEGRYTYKRVKIC